ncbi:LOW QUALITY PROTEIN: protein turtle-like [Dermacentor silvarum]|uniref:LOW QUALITY PROTEIN: protein turtle-like n=1 Tax=Dermacentor silvarum TaxID=543639 RepID=UPI002100E2A9|nr:LOW QUALITY PROTEIN: protein turtle-like [Dermacentor silvarum]
MTCGRHFRRRSCWTLLAVAAFCFCGTAVQGRYQAVTVEPRTVSAVEGGQVQLNCDLRAPAADDFAVRIRWLKEHAEPGGEGDAGVTVPVYSVDVNSRTGSLSQIRQRTHLGSLRGRAYFSVIQTPAALNVDRLRSSDNGTYVCSVDFKMGWTRSAVVHLVVVVPPKRPLITDENGTEIRNLTRPYEEGEDLTLVCDVYGGQPEPVVTWWRGSQLLQQALSRAPDGHPRATLLRLRLTRADYRAKLTCRAANSNVSEASTASVIVNMHLQPIAVEIKGNRGPLSAEMSTQVICQVEGSRPPASVRWLLGSRELSDYATRATSSETTLSVLSFVPSAWHNGERLRCLASNTFCTRQPETPLEDSWRLDIHYAPIIELRLGIGLNAANLHEGMDVYFECHVRANPPVGEVSWTFDDRDLHTDAGRGIIVSNQSLALRSVNRTNSGAYACHATNSEGEASSTSHGLRIKYAPVCRTSQQRRIYSIGKHDTVHVTCDMEADPVPGPSRGATARPTATTHSGRTPRSTRQPVSRSAPCYAYTPRHDADYGTLSCGASNAIGDSTRPCIFQVVPIGGPVQPSNCVTREATSDALLVSCQRRSGAPENQEFLLELRDGPPQAPIRANLTAAGQPSFRVHSLQPGTLYRLAVYGVNANGRSEPVLLTAYTLPVEQELLGQEAGLEINTGTLVAAVLSAVAAFLVVFIALMLIKLRHKFIARNATNSWNQGDSHPNENEDLNTDLRAENMPDMITTKQVVLSKAGSDGTPKISRSKLRASSPS